MKKERIITFFLASFCLIYASILICCDKNDDDHTNGSGKTPFEFTALEADADTIFLGSSTNIKAYASGFNLSYSWKATEGSILGSGQEITYTTSPCSVGTNTISCTVKDDNDNSETKSIQIVVL